MSQLKSCAEDGPTPVWFKSSHSSNDGPDCVEVAASPGLVHIRDSTRVPGPRVVVTPAAWSAFVAKVGVES